MTPPNVPPEKRPDRHYDFGRMNMVFALSALALLATTLWMVFADYAQPWKRFQAEFRNLERQKLLRDMETEKQRLNQQEIAQITKEIEAAEAQLASQKDEIERLEGEIKDLNGQIYAADATWRATKSLLDTARYEYDAALQSKGGVEKASRRVTELRDKLAADKRAVEDATARRDAVAAQLAERRAAVTAGEEKLAGLNQGLEGLNLRLASLQKDLDYFLLNAPLLDFVLPTLSVQQVILPGLYHDINFTEIERVDRCATCHVAANRPGFDGEEWQEPYRSHPRLDLFVGDSSPHPYTRFGCTSCHGGLDRATDFARAGHSPVSEEQKKEWVKRYGWEKQPYLETPILPAGSSEAGCVTCHAGQVWTGQSEIQDAGRELVTHMGCNGCHVIDHPAYTNLRKPGPSLARIAGKTSPEWAYRWIEEPRAFHPTTYMPHFFYVDGKPIENIEGAENEARMRAEMSAIVAYLWAKSERPDYPDPPAGDPARGKAVLESVGCQGCHLLDGNAKRDDYFTAINRLHGPNLVRTGSKVDPGWLYAWVRNPKQYWPDTSMPDLRLTDEEAADVTAFLLSQRDPKFEGLRLPAVDGDARDGLVSEYLRNKHTIERSDKMLAEMSEQQKNVFLGEQTIAKYGCYGCHDIAGFEDAKPIGTDLTQEGSKPVHQFDFGHVHDVAHTRHDWIEAKILRPRRFDEGKERVKDYNELLKMPSFGMSEREAKAVLTNVLGFTKESVMATRKAGNGSARTAALAEGRKLITRYNCQGCHLIEGHGQAIKTAIKDIAMLPPNLAAEGARVQSDWLFEYLHDPSRVSMRPWLTVRMPTFGFSDEQANTLISYFAAREERTPFTSPPGQADPQSLAVGRVMFGFLQCARCHPSSGQPTASAAAGLGDLAPSLLLARGRLRHDWVPDWIKDPQEWIPGTRMPSNFPETQPGVYQQPYAAAIDAPMFAAQKQEMLRYFSSEAELKAYLSDVDKVTAALRDHIWTLSGGGGAAGAQQRATAPAPDGSRVGGP